MFKTLNFLHKIHGNRNILSVLGLIAVLADFFLAASVLNKLGKRLRGHCHDLVVVFGVSGSKNYFRFELNDYEINSKATLQVSKAQSVIQLQD